MDDPTQPADLQSLSASIDQLRTEVGRVIIGQTRLVDQLMVCLLAGGHALVEGVPGLAKTLTISTLSRALDLSFSRVQFTPDLMPSDLTGTEIFEENKSTGERSLRFIHGPVFANVVLADEINRTPPKTQAALLEAMQEGQVTAGGIRHGLPRPFFVLATQNPIEQEGTYPLPEAQLDRFMLMIRISYPSHDEELEIVRATTSTQMPVVDSVLNAQQLIALQEAVRTIPTADHVAAYALRLARSTRQDDALDVVRRYVAWGAGPRASQCLVLAAKAQAFMDKSPVVTPDHVKSVAIPVLRHRVLMNFAAEADGVHPDDVVTTLLEEIPIDGMDASTSSRVDEVIS